MKKKIIVLSLVSLFSVPVFAKFVPQSEQANKTEQISAYQQATVAEVLKMADDSRVTLEGHITNHLGKDKYQFSDASGSLTVEIDHDKWRGVDVSPNDKVQLKGKVDIEHNGVEVDVKEVTKL